MAWLFGTRCHRETRLLCIAAVDTDRRTYFKYHPFVSLLKEQTPRRLQCQNQPYQVYPSSYSCQFYASHFPGSNEFVCHDVLHPSFVGGSHEIALQSFDYFCLPSLLLVDLHTLMLQICRRCCKSEMMSVWSVSFTFANARYIYASKQWRRRYLLTRCMQPQLSWLPSQ